MKEDNLRKRKPGDPALPGAGRPKGSLNTKTILEKWLGIKEKIEHPLTGKQVTVSQLEVITLKQLQKARKGDLGAFNALLDRFEGRPDQKINNTFPEGTEINVSVGKPIRPGSKQEPIGPAEPTEPQTPDA